MSTCGDKDQCTRRSELFVGACYLLLLDVGYRGVGVRRSLSRMWFNGGLGLNGEI